MENKEIIRPKYFYFNLDYCELFDELEDEQAGKVIRSICDYIRGKESSAENMDSGAKIIVKTMKQDIDKAFKKYYAQCENGKKGGGQKGNTNAKKNKKPKIEYSELNGDLAYVIVDLIYLEAKKTDFDIDYYLKKQQIAALAACYKILDIEDIGCLTDYKTIKAFVFNESAAALCKELKACAEDYYYDELEKDDFTAEFADLKQRALLLLNEFTLEEMDKFSNMCYAIIDEAFYCDDVMKEMFTPEEIDFIMNERKKINAE